MSKFVAVIVVVAVGFFGYQRYHRARLASQPPEAVGEISVADQEESPEVAHDDRYGCDGRTRCSQFDSCEEATWFINNCPGMKMDGDNDGVPCESHLCAHS